VDERGFALSLHTLALVAAFLMVANEGASLAEESQPWTARRVVIGIPLTVIFWWLVLTVLV
jgi:hypothetical protein